MPLSKSSFCSTLSLLGLVMVISASCSPVLQYVNSDDVLHWEKDILVFDSLNAVEHSDAGTLLVTGSSSIRLWDSIHTDLAPYQVMQRGYGGAKLNDFNFYADRIIKPHQFRAILIFVANDISGGDHDRTPKEVFLLYKRLIGQIRERNPDTPVCWIEVTPTPSRWHAIDQIRDAGNLIGEYCNGHDDLFYIDTYDEFLNQAQQPDSAYFRKDMLHLNREGYALWSGIILQSLEEAGIHP